MMSDKKIDLILNKLESMDKRFDGMDKRFDDIDKRLDGMDKRLDGMDKRFDGMDKRLDRNEEMISTLIQIVGTTHSKVEELQTDVSLLLDNQKTIMQMQQDQQKILERLSIRSISHEADIAEIRRIK
jgi:chromosome segregation ATPase